CLPAHRHDNETSENCGIVLDAGSSRTTVCVYQWPAEKENNTGVVSQTFKCSVKGSGISSYENNPREAPKAFDDCMLRVKEQVPENLHGSTRIYLGATAGMRLLRLKNETAAHEVLESIQSYFESQPFDFRGAQIISGQEEGVYRWITANNIMGNFLEKNLWHMWVHPHGVDTTGALDLGGASTQISFVSGEKMEPNASDTVQVSLYGYTHTLYTHSFQCYGRNEAEKFLAMLLQSSPTETNISNPCYPRGYSTSFDLGYVFGSLCTEKQRPDSNNPYDAVTFTGTGDPWLCREKVASVFDFKACQEQDACSFDGIYQPKVQGPFVAFAGFYYTASALNLSGSFSLMSFNRSSWDFCRHAWIELPSLLPRFDEVYAWSYCFSAHYIYHLLVNGYKFTEETWPQICFEKKVGEQQHLLVPRIHAQLDQPDPSGKYPDPSADSAPCLYGHSGLLHRHRLAVPGVSSVSMCSFQDKGTALRMPSNKEWIWTEPSKPETACDSPE
ncbi:Ectonucleoside triphosphate diphosphohydrolase 3, partial [Lemmus lemmus]